jgi:hypothetical protein
MEPGRDPSGVQELGGWQFRSTITVSASKRTLIHGRSALSARQCLARRARLDAVEEFLDPGAIALMDTTLTSRTRALSSVAAEPANDQ